MWKYRLIVIAAAMLAPFGFELQARAEVTELPSDDGWLHLEIKSRGLRIGRRTPV